MAVEARRKGRSDLKAWPIRAALLAASLAIAGCAAPAGPISEGTAGPREFGTPRPTATPPTEPVDIVLSWIECEDECAAALQAVVQLGPDATPLLVQIVTEGPPAARVEAMQDHLRITYEELAAYGETHPEAALRLGEAEYLGLYLDNYAALYRIRSAQALVAIGDPQATSALQVALRSSERQDVREAILEALRELGGQ